MGRLSVGDLEQSTCSFAHVRAVVVAKDVVQVAPLRRRQREGSRMHEGPRDHLRINYPIRFATVINPAPERVLFDVDAGKAAFAASIGRLSPSPRRRA